jgi:TonB family protein
MNPIVLYLIKSASWLAGFVLVYLMFLRNERYFFLNRIYLAAGMLATLIFPFWQVHYTVYTSAVIPETTGYMNIPVTQISNTQIIPDSTNPDWKISMMVFYFMVVAFLIARFIYNTKPVIRILRNTPVIRHGPVKVIRNDNYSFSFSFFTYVFINNSIPDIEKEEIINHELVHIRQHHWIDLFLAELLCIIQWFNPFAWIYMRQVRQNHEYLADNEALMRTSNPAIYRATLINQMYGSPIINLGNSFNYSLNKKRFTMMKKISGSPIRKMKILLILPVVAIIMYSFAKPEYRYKADLITPVNTSSGIKQEGNVRGVVSKEDGKPLQGTTVVIAGTTVGTVTDSKGHFAMEKVPDESTLVFSYVGYKSIRIKPDMTKMMLIRMARDTFAIQTVAVRKDHSWNDVAGIEDNPPLIFLDGVKIDRKKMRDIDPGDIQNLTVLKNEPAIKKYGDEGKYGVILITSKNASPDKNKTEENNVRVPENNKEKIYTIVEEMPSFPGGQSALTTWLNEKIIYPEDAARKKISGEVEIGFVVSSKGKIEGVRIVRPLYPSIDKEAYRVVSSLPDWNPGMQNGKAVDVYYVIPISFEVK